MRQDLEEAERGYRAALEIEPNHRNALFGLATVLEKTSRTSESVQYFERLLSIDPADPVAAAAVLIYGANDSEIESSLKLLLQQYPDSAHLHFTLGVHLVTQQRWPDARLAFLNAYALDPANSDYSYNLAVTMEQMGRFDEARTYYEAALGTVNEHSEPGRHAIEKRISRLAAIVREPT